MHQTTLCAIDTLRSTNLGKAELGVDYLFGGFQHQRTVNAVLHISHTLGIFRLHIGGDGLLVLLAVGLECGTESDALSGLNDISAIAIDFSLDDIGAIHTLGRIGLGLLHKFGHSHGERTRGDVLHLVCLAHHGQCGAGKTGVGNLHHWRGSTFTCGSGIHHAYAILAHHLQSTVDGHLLHAQLHGSKSVHTEQRNNVGLHAVHQTGMGVVGDGAQHGENQRTLLREVLHLVNAPTSYKRHHLSAHLNVVGIRDGLVRKNHLNGVCLGIDGPALFLGLHCHCRQQQQHNQFDLFHSLCDYYWLFMFIIILSAPSLSSPVPWVCSRSASHPQDDP